MSTQKGEKSHHLLTYTQRSSFLIEISSHSSTTAYYRGAMGIMLVYDITQEKSFENIKNWIRNIEENASADVEKMLLGNKCELNEKRQVRIVLCHLYLYLTTYLPKLNFVVVVSLLNTFRRLSSFFFAIFNNSAISSVLNKHCEMCI